MSPHPAPPGRGPAPAGPALPDLVLVDFDGTLAVGDVGNRFFGRFAADRAAWARLIDDWKAGRVTARECLARECSLARVGPEEAAAFVDGFALAPDAGAFVAAARAAGCDLLVASDGLGFYIERLLARAGLDLPFTANRLCFEAGALVPEYASRGPAVALAGGRLARVADGAEEGCGRCGNCKGALLRRARVAGRHGRLLLVGDGFSDRCAAGEADVVHATGELLAHCREHGIPARPFARLSDVVAAEGWPAGNALAGGGAAPAGAPPGFAARAGESL